jgi:hypothetical protein
MATKSPKTKDLPAKVPYTLIFERSTLDDLKWLQAETGQTVSEQIRQAVNAYLLNAGGPKARAREQKRLKREATLVLLKAR